MRIDRKIKRGLQRERRRGTNNHFKKFGSRRDNEIIDKVPFVEH